MRGLPSFVWVSLGVLLLLAGLNAYLTPDLSERNAEFFTEMVYSKAKESFSPSELLPQGRTQQSLVAGVVARGRLPFGFAPGAAEAGRAGRELKSPLQDPSAADLERGRELYGIYCALCHDPKGDGRGIVVEHGMLPPPSLHAVRAEQMGDGEMFHILTLGQGNMASYAAQLSAEERWKVIAYVRFLQEAN